MSQLGWCAAERIDELQAFIDAFWKRGHVLARDAELLRWQHPRDDGTLSVLVADGEDGAMQGILGVIPVGFCAHGARHPGAWLTTWVVRPEERARQTGLVLLRRVIEETPGMVGTLGGNETTMRILRALRFTTQPAVPRWVRPVSEPALDAVVAAAGVEADPATREAWSAAARSALPPAPGSIAVRGWDHEAAAAWDAAFTERFAPSLVGTWRDAAYVRWRYLDHPRFAYDVRVALGEDGAARGLLVARRQAIAGLDASVVRIVELLGDEEAGRALVAAALGEAHDAGVAFADFFCTSERFAAPLLDAGFLREQPDRAVLPSLFQPLDARRTALTGAWWADPEALGTEDLFAAGDDVYFTRSDCDQDRPN